MHMRIVWGRIVPGQWEKFEAAFEQAIKISGSPKGLNDRWLARDQADPDAGYSITLWESEGDMKSFWDSSARTEAMDLLRPYFMNQYTVTECEIRLPR